MPLSRARRRDMRNEQQMNCRLMEAQADVQRDVKKWLERLAREPRDRV